MVGADGAEAAREAQRLIRLADFVLAHPARQAAALAQADHAEIAEEFLVGPRLQPARDAAQAAVFHERA